MRRIRLAAGRGRGAFAIECGSLFGGGWRLVGLSGRRLRQRLSGQWLLRQWLLRQWLLRQWLLLRQRLRAPPAAAAIAGAPARVPAAAGRLADRRRGDHLANARVVVESSFDSDGNLDRSRS